MREGLCAALRRKGFRSCRCQHCDGVTVSVTLATTWTLLSVFMWLRALFSATSIPLHLLKTLPPGEAETAGLPNISPHARVYVPAPCRPVTWPLMCRPGGLAPGELSVSSPSRTLGLAGASLPCPPEQELWEREEGAAQRGSALQRLSSDDF